VHQTVHRHKRRREDIDENENCCFLYHFQFVTTWLPQPLQRQQQRDLLATWEVD
jgi:hypothetical protein